MLENIGIWVYLYTIVDRLSCAATAGVVLFAILTVGVHFLYGVIADEERADEERSWGTKEQAEKTEAKRKVCLKVTIPAFFFCVLLAIFIPTRDDVKLIAGVVVGAKVAEQTIETVSESEIVGKVLDIVEKKIDNVLADMDNTNKEDKK